MTWTRTPQEYPDRADVLAVSRSARWLLIEMFSWSNAQLTNGRVPRSILRRISDAEDVQSDVAELLREGLLEEPEEGFLVLDWTNQEDADTVQARSARNAEKTKRARERKERHLGGDHSMCVAPYCKLGTPLSVTGNTTGKHEGNETGKHEGNETGKHEGKPTGKRTGPVTPLQSSPVQSVRSKGLELDRGRGQASANATVAAPGPEGWPDGQEDVRPPGFTDERWARYLAARASVDAVMDADAAAVGYGGDHADPADSLAGLIPAGGAGGS